MEKKFIVSASVSDPSTSNFSALPSVSRALLPTIDLAAPDRCFSEAYPATRPRVERDRLEVGLVLEYLPAAYTIFFFLFLFQFDKLKPQL